MSTRSQGKQAHGSFLQGKVWVDTDSEMVKELPIPFYLCNDQFLRLASTRVFFTKKFTFGFATNIVERVYAATWE